MTLDVGDLRNGAVPIASGLTAEAALGQLGFSVSEARVGKVVDLEVDASDANEARAQVERMCEQLLANPLIESFEVEIHG